MESQMKMPEAHPAADLFPMLGERELRDLADDIRQRGLQQPIVIFEKKILDGRNRWRACEIAGVEPQTVQWKPAGEADPIAYVVSLNLKRRHLDESQRAMCAAAAKGMYEVEARERQRAAAERTNAIRAGETLVANLPPPQEDQGKSRDKAAALFNVSPRSVESASKVRREAVPEIVKAVERGDVSVSAAAVIAELPPEEQRAAAIAGHKTIIKKSKEIRSAKNEDRRRERVQKLAEISRSNAPLLAPQRFPVLLADPPWRYESGSTDPTRDIENHYPTMSLDDICAMPVASSVTDDAILFLWHPPGMATEAVRVATSWGFRERSSWVWIKPSIGPGYWGRLRHEMLMICTRGKFPAPAPADRPDSVITASRDAHSAKPAEVAERIERMFPSLPKAELFSRSPRDGWFAWGNQTKGKSRA